MNIQELKTGDCFSELSHYRFIKTVGNNSFFTHIQSGKEVTLNNKYVTELLKCAEVYDNVVTVGKEDKYWTQAQLTKANNTTNRVGDVRVKGIRTLWQEIHSQQVFTVCWDKNPKAKTKKAYGEEITQLTESFLDGLQKAKTSKKSMTAYVETELPLLLKNPVQEQSVEERILRGYKVQFQSRNGMYDVVDMDITKGMNQRQVNINTIKWLIFDGIRYEVK